MEAEEADVNAGAVQTYGGQDCCSSWCVQWSTFNRTPTAHSKITIADWVNVVEHLNIISDLRIFLVKLTLYREC